MADTETAADKAEEVEKKKLMEDLQRVGNEP